MAPGGRRRGGVPGGAGSKSSQAPWLGPNPYDPPRLGPKLPRPGLDPPWLVWIRWIHRGWRGEAVWSGHGEVTVGGGPGSVCRRPTHAASQQVRRCLILSAVAPLNPKPYRGGGGRGEGGRGGGGRWRAAALPVQERERERESSAATLGGRGTEEGEARG